MHVISVNATDLEIAEHRMIVWSNSGEEGADAEAGVAVEGQSSRAAGYVTDDLRHVGLKLCKRCQQTDCFSFFPTFQLSLFPSVLVFLSQVSYLSHNRLFLDFYFSLF